MKEFEKIAKVNDRFQAIVAEFLIADDSTISGSLQHIDDDTLTAFTEGSMSQREAKPVVAHLAACGHCRNITVELVRTEMAMAGEDRTEMATESTPATISSVLSGIVSRLFERNDAAVFAHGEKEEDDEEDKAEEKDKKE
ncbi:MAG TPA: hypothetical protein PKA82_09030 [Pyrinomonadaceae bacterium]|nr:hypothetical protein [Pyrinomonadaceae bacterium]